LASEDHPSEETPMPDFLIADHDSIITIAPVSEAALGLDRRERHQRALAMAGRRSLRRPATSSKGSPTKASTSPLSTLHEPPMHRGRTGGCAFLTGPVQRRHCLSHRRGPRLPSQKKVPQWRVSIGKPTLSRSSRFQPRGGGPVGADRLKLPQIRHSLAPPNSLAGWAERSRRALVARSASDLAHLAAQGEWRQRISPTVKIALDERPDIVREAAPHEQDHNHNASHRRPAERFAVPEIRPAAGALCGRDRAWHARKFARFLRPRKEFGRVKTTRIMIGRSVEPSREYPAEGFLFWLFAFGAASAQRHDTEGSVEAPSPRPVKARLQRSSFFNF
jgi:hypothetical protein